MMAYTLIVAANLALPIEVLAHNSDADGGAHDEVVTGALHPLHGLDHILAMLAVGVWATQVGGRAAVADARLSGD